MFRQPTKRQKVAQCVCLTLSSLTLKSMYFFDVVLVLSYMC